MRLSVFTIKHTFHLLASCKQLYSCFCSVCGILMVDTLRRLQHLSRGTKMELLSDIIRWRSVLKLTKSTFGTKRWCHSQVEVALAGHTHTKNTRSYMYWHMHIIIHTLYTCTHINGHMHMYTRTHMHACTHVHPYRINWSWILLVPLNIAIFLTS